jgi:two-component system chemotaxis response regulator CheY
LSAVLAALEAGRGFELICLDIMMPQMDGQEVLSRIIEMEQCAGIAAEDRAKIMMTTALGDRRNLNEAGEHECDAYLVKPIDKGKILGKIHAFGIASP